MSEKSLDLQHWCASGVGSRMRLWANLPCNLVADVASQCDGECGQLISFGLNRNSSPPKGGLKFTAV